MGRSAWERAFPLRAVPIVFLGPYTPCLDVFSTFCACTMQDAVLPGQSYSDLCVPCS